MSEPIVPSEVDLRDFPYMPLQIERLRRSKAWLRAKKQPELAFYMLNLWTASWHELPAASLENDDEVLADLAMCPENKWPKVKEAVLRGWIAADDGRLYHPIVAEVAMEAWKARIDQRKRTAAATAAREAKRAAHHEPPAIQRDEERDVRNTEQRDDLRNVERNEQRDDDATFTKGSEGKRREAKLKGSDTLKRDVEIPPTQVAPVDNFAPNVNGADGKIDSSTAKGNGVGQEWSNESWVAATAITVGKPRNQGEPFDAWKDRVYGAVQAMRAQAQH